MAGGENSFGSADRDFDGYGRDARKNGGPAARSAESGEGTNGGSDSSRAFERNRARQNHIRSGINCEREEQRHHVGRRRKNYRGRRRSAARQYSRRRTRRN